MLASPAVQSHRFHRSVWRLSQGVAAVCAAFLLGACSIKDIVSVPRPSNILDPNQLKTYDGAISLANGAQSVFNATFLGDHAINGSGLGSIGPYAVASGVLTDEYTTWSQDAVDGRRSDFNTPGSTTIFSFIGNAHMNAGQAIQYLHLYASSAPTQYLANMFIVRAYTDIFLAEFYCNGVPLSDASPDGSVAYTAPISKDSMENDAIAELDSALVYAPTDSTGMINLIKLGQARAYMNLKQYDKAAQAVSGIPTSYNYSIGYASNPFQAQGWFEVETYVTVADNEGVNGLNFISAHDPRVSVDSVTSVNGIPIYVPRNLHASTVNAVLENGIAARLIEAEDQLSKQDYTTWLTTLNTLRTTCTSAATCPTPAPAGTGGVAGLPPLSDPGTDQARLLLTFRERAFWLFGTGHRQGDLRRLVRQYGLPQQSVYPTGFWRDGLQYGSYTNAFPDVLELKNNPKYSAGCFDRDA